MGDLAKVLTNLARSETYSHSRVPRGSRPYLLPRSRPGNLPDSVSAAAPWTGRRTSASPAVYQIIQPLFCAGEQPPMVVQRPAQDR